MKYFLFVIFSLFSSLSYSFQTVEEACPFGHKKSTRTGVVAFSDDPINDCEGIDYSGASFLIIGSPIPDQENGRCLATIIDKDDCGTGPENLDCPVNTACTPPDPDPDCPPGQICYKCSGSSVFDPVTKQCRSGGGDGSSSGGDGSSSGGDGSSSGGDGSSSGGDGSSSGGDGSSSGGDGSSSGGDGSSSGGDGSSSGGSGGGSGSSGGGGSGGSGSGGGSGVSDKDQNEDQCGIGQVSTNSGCRPIPDNCGYVNGAYHCTGSPPSGCGTIGSSDGDIDGCFEERQGCGWIDVGNGPEYGCFDADDSQNCQGGILINGVCNQSGSESSCPSGYVNQNGSCVNPVNNCPIGTGTNPVTGACESDDCPPGKYSRFGQCLDIPSNPGTGSSSGGSSSGSSSSGGDGSSSGSDGVDLSSLNNRLDRILQQSKNSDSNNSNNLNKVNSSVNRLNETNSKILSEVEGVSQSIDDLSENLTDEINADSERNQIIDGVSSALSQNSDVEEALNAQDSLVSGDSPFNQNQPSGISDNISDVIPSYQACNEFNMNFPGISISVPCERFEQLKSVFSWVLYIYTLMSLFDIVTRPVESKI